MWNGAATPTREAGALDQRHLECVGKGVGDDPKKDKRASRDKSTLRDVRAEADPTTEYQHKTELTHPKYGERIVTVYPSCRLLNASTLQM